MAGEAFERSAIVLQVALRKVCDATPDTSSKVAVFNIWTDVVSTAGCHHVHLLLVRNQLNALRFYVLPACLDLIYAEQTFQQHLYEKSKLFSLSIHIPSYSNFDKLDNNIALAPSKAGSHAPDL